MKIIVKKTTELTDNEISSIYSLFKEIFGKERNISFFKEEFGNTPKGYSYHAIGFDENDHVIAHNAYVPFQYLKNEKPFWLALSIDAMIHPAYRGQGIYKRLLSACSKAAQEDGCIMRIGFPNQNSYPIQIKKFNLTDIGKLDIYCNVIKISGIVPQLKIFDILSIPISFCFLLLSYISRFATKVQHPEYSKDRKNFDCYRYKWFSGDYHIIQEKGFQYTYKIDQFKGIKAAFIMDVYPLSKSNLDKACRSIFFNEFKHIPLILYVGKLKFTPLSLVKIPHFIEPKHFHFVGKIYDTKQLDKDALDITNWDINLSNFDLL